MRVSGSLNITSLAVMVEAPNIDARFGRTRTASASRLGFIFSKSSQAASR